LNDSTFPYWLNGDLDEIRIYNRALNEEEINALCLLSVLPIKFTKFDASVIDKQIKLNWNIANEDGIQNYVVERSITGVSDFVPLKTISAKNIHSYSFVDNTTDENKLYYYRVAVHGNSNSLIYSEIRAIKINAKNKLTILYPNSAKGNIVASLSGYNGKAKITILNSAGQVMWKKDVLISNNIPISLSLNNHFSGVYSLRLETISEVFVKRIVIL
jgi:hypothetical protein